MKKFIKLLLDLIIFILILIILFLSYQFYQDYFKVKNDANQSYNDAVEKYESTEAVCKNKTIKATENPPSLTTADFNPNEQIGYISGPTIGLEAAVIMGDSNDGLSAAMNYGVSIDPAGKMPGTKGNTVIAGHREFAFKSLENVEEKTPVILNINGNFYTYEVTKAQEIADTDVDKVFFDDGKERVVLYTCYPFKFNSTVTGRYAVYLEPVDSVQVDCENI